MAGTSLVKDDVEEACVSVFTDVNLLLDDTVDERRQKIVHQTVAASPY